MSEFHRPAPGTKIASVAQAVDELRSIRDLMRWACSRMNDADVAFGQSAVDARTEAIAVMSWALALPPDEMEDWFDCRLSRSEREVIALLVDRRCSERVPAAYLTGEAWLAGLCFRCDPRALIPRSLIAETMQGALVQWLDEHPRRDPGWPATILDLCTGGGSLAILAALAFPEASVTGCDLSPEALELAATNRDLHGLQTNVRFLQGDCFEPVKREKFDLILCNPPYVNDFSMGNLPAEFRSEPRLALAGGPDGMDLIRRILAGAPSHLNPDGALVLEIGHEAEHFERAFPKLEHHWLGVSAGDRMIALIEARSLRRAAARAA